MLASNIATARGVSRPTISALVSSLVQKGLVSQAEDPGDRRQKALQATPAGLAVLDRIEPARRRANKELLADFEPARSRSALRILRSCLDSLWSATLSETERQRFANGSVIRMRRIDVGTGVDHSSTSGARFDRFRITTTSGTDARSRTVRARVRVRVGNDRHKGE